MPLRLTVQGSPETLSEMLLAAEDRYAEAEDLLVAQRFDGCVYLLGYSVEMWLKAACLRLHNPGQPSLPVKGALPPLKAWMKNRAPAVPFGDYHDLSFFVACLLELRLNAGRPVSVPLATELQTRISHDLYNEWIVDMRYRRSALSASDAWSALLHGWWMKQNWINLI